MVSLYIALGRTLSQLLEKACVMPFQSYHVFLWFVSAHTCSVRGWCCGTRQWNEHMMLVGEEVQHAPGVWGYCHTLTRPLTQHSLFENAEKPLLADP